MSETNVKWTCEECREIWDQLNSSLSDTYGRSHGLEVAVWHLLEKQRHLGQAHPEPAASACRHTWQRVKGGYRCISCKDWSEDAPPRAPWSAAPRQPAPKAPEPGAPAESVQEPKFANTIGPYSLRAELPAPKAPESAAPDSISLDRDADFVSALERIKAMHESGELGDCEPAPKAPESAALARLRGVYCSAGPMCPSMQAFRELESLITREAQEHQTDVELLTKALAWHTCQTHGQIDAGVAWGCPECVRALRQEVEQLTKERNEAIRILNNRSNRVRQVGYELIEEVFVAYTPRWRELSRARLDKAAAPTPDEARLEALILDSQVQDKINSGKGMEPAK